MQTIRRATLLLTILLCQLVLSGCLDENICGRFRSDNLAISIGIAAHENDLLAYRFGCEASEADYPIDRYWFAFELPGLPEVRVEPSDHELSNRSLGSITYYVTVDDTAPSNRAPASPHYVLGFRQWDPAQNGGLIEPEVSVRWVEDSEEPAYHRLPRGEYAVEVGLRSHPEQELRFNVTV